jgi:hypothetical protein
MAKQNKKNLSAKEINEALEAQNRMSAERIRIIEEELASLSRIFDVRQRTSLLKTTEKRVESNKILLQLGRDLKAVLKSNISYLLEADKIIKSSTLALGLSGSRATEFRNSLEDSAGYAARLGMSIEQLAAMQVSLAEETGRVQIATEESAKAMVNVAKGTALSNDEAAKLVGQFDLIGVNAVSSAKQVQTIVDTTERMGLNTTKVLKSVSNNFKKLQTYTFRGGVQAFGELAAFSEKFKVNMESTLDSMETTRMLDGAVETAAQLQVLGGQFANLADPMAMLFESRNDPQAYAERLQKMTQGMVTLKKTQDGFNFELASPMARDQLERAAKALGKSTEEMTEIAMRTREVQELRKQMMGMGLSNREKEIVEGAKQFDTDTGRFFVMVGGIKKDLNEIRKDDFKVLEQQKTSLEDRAKAAQSFDEAFNATIAELKTSLLPVLRGVNSVLEMIRPYAIQFNEFIGDLSKSNKGFLKAAGMFGTAFLLGKGLVGGIGKLLPKLGVLAKGVGSMFMKGGGAAVGKGAGNAVGGAVGKATGRGGGMGSLAKGAGIGAAALGAGAGVKLAAEGLSELANSMKELDETQIWALPATMLAMSVGAFALAPAIGALGAAGTAGSLGLIALGVAAAGIGFGINQATTGVANLFGSLESLEQLDLLSIGAGLSSIAGATLLFANPLSIVGAAGLATAIGLIASNGDDMMKVGMGFEKIGAVLQGSTENFKAIRETVDAISSADAGGNNAIANLAALLSKPLKVEFAENEVTLVARVNMNVDGRKFFEETDIARKVEIRQSDYQSGKSSPSRG